MSSSPYVPNLEGRRANLDRLMKGGSSGDVATCEECGSTYFYTVNAEQFSQGYSSVEYNALSANPRNTKICLCGTPLPSKAGVRGTAQTRGVQEEFFRSLNSAREYISSNKLSNLVKEAASPSEVENVKKLLLEKVADLQKVVEELSAKSKVVNNKKKSDEDKSTD